MILITMTWFGHVFGLQVPRPKQCKKRDDGGDFKDVFSYNLNQGVLLPFGELDLHQKREVPWDDLTAHSHRFVPIR